MKEVLKIIFFLLLVASFSCEEQGLFINCSDCNEEEPLTTDLDIKTKEGSYSDATVIKVYEGDLEDSVLYSSYHTYNTTTSVAVTINKKYTVTATYNISGDYYIAVDSATPKVRYDKEKCNNPCYFVYDRIIDLRLKYTK